MERNERIKTAKPFTLNWWLLMKDEAMYQTDWFECTNEDYTIHEWMKVWQRYTINLTEWIDQRIIDKYGE